MKKKTYFEQEYNKVQEKLMFFRISYSKYEYEE